jgi:uncharacterized protein (DUF1330 family)
MEISMPAYFVAQVKVADAEAFREYERGFFPTLKPFRGKMLIADNAPLSLEGEWPQGRTVVIEFESAEQAKQWYDSDAYQSISEVRRAHSESAMAILQGFELPKRN